MSLPISACMMIRACADEEAYRVLLDRLRYNLKHGSMYVADCPHDPPCTPPSREEQEKLEERLVTDLAKDKDESPGVVHPKTEGSR